MLGALLGGPLELADLPGDRRGDRLRQLQRVSPGAVVVGTGLTVTFVTQLLADGLELAAEQELALGLLHPLLDVGLDPLAQGDVGQHLARPAEDQAEALHDIDRLQHGHLLVQRQVRRVAGQVGDPARLGRVGQALGQPARPAGHQDVLHHRPVLAGQLDGHLASLGVVVGDQVDLHPQGAAGSGDRGAQSGTLDAPDGHGGHPTGQLAPLGDLGHHPDRGVAPVDERHDDQRSPGGLGGLDGRHGLLGLEGHGEHHAGQQDAGGEGQEGQVVVGHRGRPFGPHGRGDGCGLRQ